MTDRLAPTAPGLRAQAYANLHRHMWKLLALLACANAGLLAYLGAGAPKPWAEIDWMDVAGEGGSALFALVWFAMLLKARPAGRVTNLLALGLGCIFFSLWMDVLDEFIALPDAWVWDNWLESGPMPLGWLTVTIGLYHWHQEQLAINAQMEKRESLFREHRLFDALTPLARADYLRRQLDMALAQSRRDRQPLSLVAVDLDGFGAINRRYGPEEGDAVLLAVSQLLLLNLRAQDLLCRLAGDRFVVLLPHTGEAQAWRMADELRASVRHLAHRTREHGERLHLRAAVSVVMAVRESGEELLDRLNHSFLADGEPVPALA